MGMFNEAPSVSRLSVVLLDFGATVNDDYPVDSHSNDSTGEADEYLYHMSRWCGNLSVGRREGQY